jgi:hypothetical protein
MDNIPAEAGNACGGFGEFVFQNIKNVLVCVANRVFAVSQHQGLIAVICLKGSTFDFSLIGFTDFGIKELKGSPFNMALQAVVLAAYQQHQRLACQVPFPQTIWTICIGYRKKPLLKPSLRSLFLGHL